MRLGPGSSGTVWDQTRFVRLASIHWPPLALQKTLARATLSAAFPAIVNSAAGVSIFDAVVGVMVGFVMSRKAAVNARPERIWNFKALFNVLLEPLQPSKTQPGFGTAVTV